MLTHITLNAACTGRLLYGLVSIHFTILTVHHAITHQRTAHNNYAYDLIPTHTTLSSCPQACMYERTALARTLEFVEKQNGEGVRRP